MFFHFVIMKTLQKRVFSSCKLEKRFKNVFFFYFVNLKTLQKYAFFLKWKTFQKCGFQAINLNASKMCFWFFKFEKRFKDVFFHVVNLKMLPKRAFDFLNIWKKNLLKNVLFFYFLNMEKFQKLFFHFVNLKHTSETCFFIW